ncbi:hypothetical protein ACRYCC_30905 [Actinomadura scrupuli]|uniref:hypothetical protein n=1 Tax=Actinomadura scrupuli TaxID=559629 RepID=UPI003D987839
MERFEAQQRRHADTDARKILGALSRGLGEGLPSRLTRWDEADVHFVAGRVQ